VITFSQIAARILCNFASFTCDFASVRKCAIGVVGQGKVIKPLAEVKVRVADRSALQVGAIGFYFGLIQAL